MVIGGLFGVKQCPVQIDGGKSVLFGLLLVVVLVYFLLSISILLLRLTVFRSKSVGKLLSAEIWSLSNTLQKDKCSDVHFVQVFIKLFVNCKLIKTSACIAVSKTNLGSSNINDGYKVVVCTAHFHLIHDFPRIKV